MEKSQVEGKQNPRRRDVAQEKSGNMIMINKNYQSRVEVTNAWKVVISQGKSKDSWLGVLVQTAIDFPSSRLLVRKFLPYSNELSQMHVTLHRLKVMVCYSRWVLFLICTNLVVNYISCIPTIYYHLQVTIFLQLQECKSLLI